MDSEVSPDRQNARRREANMKGKDPKVDRKRIQNRLSQQSSREKQAAYVRQLESFVELIKSKSEDDNDENKYSKLLGAHLKLLNEKLELEEALFRFRRRLLSVGNMATSAADDKVFTALQPESSKCSHKSSSPTEKFTEHTVSATADGLDSPTNQINPATSGTTNGENNPSFIPGTAYPEQTATLLNGVDAFPQSSLGFDSWNQIPPSVVSPNTPFTQTSASLKSSIPNDVSNFGNVHHPLMPVLSSRTTSCGNMVINNSTVFADQIIFAAKITWFKTNKNSPELDEALWDFNPPKLAPQRSTLVQRIASTAVEVIGNLAGLKPYINGVCFSKYMESIVRWRISNTTEDRLAIPVPFRPTPLQVATPNHPVVIDFINWPSLRDQMILYSSSLDLDSICRDIVLNTVIEIPHRRVAVNIHNLYFSRILPKVRGLDLEYRNSMLLDPGWIYLQLTPASPFFGVSLFPTQEALAAEITSRMTTQHGHYSSTSGVSGSGASSMHRSEDSYTGYDQKTRVSHALAHFGIDQPCKWKLSKDFALKYPCFDCSLDVTEYEMVPCSMLSSKDMDF